MKRLSWLAFAVILPCCAFAIAASQEWVKAYVDGVANGTIKTTSEKSNSIWLTTGTNLAVVVIGATDTNLVDTVIAWDGVEPAPYHFANLRAGIHFYQNCVTEIVGDDGATNIVQSTSLTVDGVDWVVESPLHYLTFVSPDGESRIQGMYRQVSDYWKIEAWKEATP